MAQDTPVDLAAAAALAVLDDAWVQAIAGVAERGGSLDAAEANLLRDMHREVRGAYERVLRQRFLDAEIGGAGDVPEGADTPPEANDRDAAERWVQEHVEVHAVIGRYSGDPMNGWVHTHGLAVKGLPELEIRDVNPDFLVHAAAYAINLIAGYMVATGKVVRAGETFQARNGPVLTFSALPPLEPEDAGILRLTITGSPQVCEVCGKPDGDCEDVPEDRPDPSEDELSNYERGDDK